MGLTYRNSTNFPAGKQSELTYDELNENFNYINGRFVNVNGEIVGINAEIASIKARLNAIETSGGTAVRGQWAYINSVYDSKDTAGSGAQNTSNVYPMGLLEMAPGYIVQFSMQYYYYTSGSTMRVILEALFANKGIVFNPIDNGIYNTLSGEDVSQGYDNQYTDKYILAVYKYPNSTYASVIALDPNSTNGNITRYTGGISTFATLTTLPKTAGTYATINLQLVLSDMVSDGILSFSYKTFDGSVKKYLSTNFGATFTEYTL